MWLYHLQRSRLTVSILNKPFIWIFLSLIIDFAQVKAAEPDVANIIIQDTITIATQDEFPLSANYFQGAKANGGVLLLHGCHSTNTVYNSLAETLAKHDLHALALDYRGYGNSINETFNERSVKLRAQNIVSYQAEMIKITTYWNGDVAAAYQFLKQQIDDKRGIAVITIGCAIEQAVALAENVHLSALVVLTPNISDIEKERYKNLLDFPTYFIASTHSTESYNTATELFAWNGDKNSKLQSLKGDRSGPYILRRSPEIAQDIALWLKTKSLK